MHKALKTSITLLALLSGVAWAQSDYHVTQDPNRIVYTNSAFAHGHRHGYEEGFHAGDEDYQFRRPASVQPKLPKSRGYRHEFGDKASFMRGFESGFRSGYADSYSGRSFRAGQRLLPDANYVLAAAAPEKQTMHEFDSGVSAGYKDGYSNLVNIASEPGVSEPVTWRCRQERHDSAYCDGYAPGYVLGRADSESISFLHQGNAPTLARNTH